jgi:tripartite-type tricarboxylate transporter receptor subunit TctC
MFRSNWQTAVWGLAFLLSLPLGALDAAQVYPNQPIKIIVTFPPGGSADIVIRALQPLLAEDLHQTLVIENRSGAGGNIGIGAVAQSAPDGYTIGVAAAGVLTVNPHLNRAAMSFDPLKDLAPITLLAEIPFVLVASQAAKLNSVADVIQAAKADPGGISIGHGGNGTAMHLTSALFAQKAGIELQLVSYRGTAPAAVDVLAGHIPLAVLDIPASQQLIRDGKLKALGVSAAKRVAFRVGRMVRPGGSRRHPARDHQPAERRLREGPERSRGRRQDSYPRRRTGSLFAGKVRGVHCERKPEMGQADHRRRDQERMMATADRRSKP